MPRRAKDWKIGDQVGANTCRVCGAEVGKVYFDGALGPFRKVREVVVPGARLLRVDGILRWHCAGHAGSK